MKYKPNELWECRQEHEEQRRLRADPGKQSGRTENSQTQSNRGKEREKD